MKFILSDSSINYLGIRLLSNGGDFSQFEKNPIMLYKHDYDKVIGYWKNLELSGDQWLAEPEFDDDDASQTYKKKVEKGSLKMASIKAEILDAIIVVENGMEIIHATKWKAIEASIVPVGGNDNALRLMYNGEEITSEKLLIELSHKSQIVNINPLNMKKIAIMLGLVEAASEEAIAAAVENLKKEAGEIATLKNEKIELARQLNDKDVELKRVQAAQQEDKAVSLVENAFVAGKISATEKDSFIKLAKADFETTKVVLDAKKAHKSMSAFVENGKSDADAAKYDGWDFKRFQKEDPIELGRIRDNEPQKYAELLKTLKK
jgi:hypothetical protein